MTLQCSAAVRDAANDAREVAIGTAPKLQLRSGAPPANCAAADSGTLLCEMSLPSDWLAASAAALKSKSGSWSGTGAAAGNAAHFRVKDSGGSACHMQGTVTASGGGGDMTIDNPSIAIGQAVQVTQFDLTEGNP